MKVAASPKKKGKTPIKDIKKSERFKKEKKKAEKALVESEETFKALAENANDGILIAVGKGVHVFANKRAGEITGYGVAELLQTSIKDLVHPDESKNIMERFRKILAGEPVPPQYEATIIHKDGKSVPIEVTSAKIVWKRQPADIVIFRDITDRRRLQEELETSEERFRRLFETSVDGLLLLEKTDGEILDSNSSAEDLLHYSHEELLKKKLWEIGVLRDDREFQEALLILEREGYLHYGSKPVETKEGLSIDAEVYLTDRAKVIQCNIRDIRERKKSEEELRAAEAKYRTLVEKVPAVVYVTTIGKNAPWFYVSPQIESLLGFTPEEWMADNTLWYRHIHPDDQEKIIVFIGTRTPYDFEYRMFTKDGRIVWVHDYAIILPNEKGEPYYQQGFMIDITERKKAEEALRESEERFRTTLEKIEDGYYEVDLAGNFTFFNDSMSMMLGYTREEIAGMNNREYMDADTAKIVYRTFNEVYRTGEPMKAVGWELIRKDGSKLFVETSVTLMKDKIGAPVGFQGICRDIAERQRAEELLRESEERFRNAFENANIGMCLVDLEMRLIRVNPQMAVMFGYTQKEMEGRSVNDFTHPEDWGISPDFIHQAISGDTNNDQFIKRYYHKQGQILWGQVSSSLVRDTAGNPLYFISHVQDITERKQAEKALQDSALQWKTTFDAMKDAVSLIDSDGKIVRCNKAMIDFLKKPLGEIIGHTCWGIKRGSPSPDAGCLLGRVLQTHRRETVILPMGDQWFNITIDPLLDDSGNLVGGVHIISDVTERKQAEEELMRSKNEVEFLNDLMSHDLSNINQAILGFLELLGETELSEKQKRYFSSAMYSARRNARLIGNVKKIQKGRFGPLSPTDLNACIEEAVKYILHPPEKAIKINYTPHSCLVLGNDLLKDVVSNLLDNAIKFDPSEEIIIDIAVSDEGEMCKLSVADKGSGIPDEYKKSIFSRWERLEKGIRGSGLGLHLIKTIVEGYGGEVWVEDNKPKGSIFNVLLPKVKQ